MSRETRIARRFFAWTWLACSAFAGALLLPGGAAAQGASDYFDSIDLDRDGRVSLEEFQQRMSWAFRQMDRNGDQVLSPEEQLVPNAPTLTLTELRRRMAEQFRRQDANKDGWLSKRELLAPPA